VKALPFTTLRIERGMPWFWDDHVLRLRETAAALGFQVPSPVDLYVSLPRAVGGTLRVRITLEANGAIRTDAEPYESPTEPWTLKTVPIEADPDIVKFKTTARPWYDAARELLATEDDAMLVLPGGHDASDPTVLETTIANLFFRIDGEIVTPAASAPLLPGIARARLLNHVPGAREAELAQSDARRATACCATNALFGVHPVGAVGDWKPYDSSELARELMDRLRSSMQESV